MEIELIDLWRVVRREPLYAQGNVADERETPIHLSGFFSPFQNLNSLDDTKS
jgi:hypothetical protein